ncbi:MAG: IS110 family transposase [Prevotellaceae bacterium]|jgi:transposase|nr:IS110 family transposase [Prevotellaceae bacterium]
MKKFVVGVDASKEKLDCCLLDSGAVAAEEQLENSVSGVSRWLKAVQQAYGTAELLVCAEHGLYTYPLCRACEEQGVVLWLENPAQIKHCSGVQRGKSDRLDARKIALYAARFSDRARPFSLPEKSIQTIRRPLSERDMYVTDRAKYRAQLSDQQRFMSKEDYKDKSKCLKALVKKLDRAIVTVEVLLDAAIEENEQLSHQRKLLCSVVGVGEKTAVKMIAATNAFKDFDDPHKFCCHAGVAPFAYCSGSSVRSQWKVSHRADKSIKALPRMAALAAATKTKGELHEYYCGKVKEGKNKMSVLNAVRAKLVHRMFAVIRNNKMYQNSYSNQLVLS